MTLNKKNINLVDITKDNMHYDWNELKPFCNEETVGYYLAWGKDENNAEIALCNASEYLEYIESKKCINTKCDLEFSCKKGDKKTNNIMHKLNTEDVCTEQGGGKSLKRKSLKRKSLKHKSLKRKSLKRKL